MTTCRFTILVSPGISGFSRRGSYTGRTKKEEQANPTIPPHARACACGGIVGFRLEIEVTSLALGDQVEAEWLPLLGLVYDPKDDLVEVALDGIDHMIPSLRLLHCFEYLPGAPAFGSSSQPQNARYEYHELEVFTKST